MIKQETAKSLSPVAASGRRSLLGAASILAVGLAGWSGAAHADGLATLDSYIKNSKSGQATFTQTVTNVNKKGTARQSSGTFSFKRPGQFRFDYTKPFKQTIVADGKTLWMYDAGLNQVTQRSQAQVLDATRPPLGVDFDERARLALSVPAGRTVSCSCPTCRGSERPTCPRPPARCTG